MTELNNKQLCESCFAETASDVCPNCGFNKAEYVSDPLVLPMGTRLNDRIVIGRVMGKGGFGVTYLGYDTRMDKVIAVKEYYPNGIAYRLPSGTEVSVADANSAEAFENGAEKFYAEAEMVAQFNGNPNIVSVYDYFKENNTVYLVMEYISGVTLKNYIKNHGRLTDGQALYVMDKIAAALSITHSAGVLHRDISPDNIMICRDGKVKLIDFGAARQIMAESSANLTVVMKPGYTPIEQYTKKGRQGAWTDIYSLGVSIYYALTEVVIDDPYARMDDDSELDKNRHGINSDLWAILKKCTMVNASDRYGSAIDLRRALKSVSAPMKSEPIELTDDDLKADSNSNFPIVSGGSASKKGNSLTTATPVSNAPESIEIFEDSIAADKKSPAKKKRKRIVIGSVCAAAVIILGIFAIAFAGNGRISDDRETNPLYIPLSDEYPGWWSSDEVNTLHKNDLNGFTGDIKVTLDIELVYEDKNGEGVYNHNLKIFDGNGNPVNVYALNTGRSRLENYSMYGEQTKFAFIVKRADIDKAYNEFRFSVENIIVKGAAVEAHDPDDDKINPNARIIQMDSKYQGYWQPSSYIPKEELESFGGDVRVTLDLDIVKEDLVPTESEYDDYWVQILPHGSRKHEHGWVTIKADYVYPCSWYDHMYVLYDVNVPDKFTFVISRSEIENLGDEGLYFEGENFIVRSAALETA